MRIVELRVENVKRLRAVRIRPDGSLIQITGKNGQGKTSVLDAIWYALGGKGAACGEPIRRGSKSASVRLDLGELTVERTWRSNGKTTLIVRNQDGVEQGTPQTILDRLVGRCTFDPLAFLRLDSKGQVELLRELTGLDCSDLDDERARLFTTRTGVNRQLHDAESVLKATPIVAAPDEETSLSDLLARQKQAMATKEKNNELRRDLEDFRREHTEKAQALGRLDDELTDAREAVAALERRIDQGRQALDESELAGKGKADRVAVLDDPNMDAITEEITFVDEVNQQVRQKKARAKKQAKVGKFREESESLTEKISDVDRRKSEKIAAAEMPVEGLAFNEEHGVTLGGLSLGQASQAEKLSLSVHIAAAMNPNLRVMLVREGSLLDSDSLALLEQLAGEQNAQVWLERVTDGEPCGVVIEDGEVKVAEVATA